MGSRVQVAFWSATIVAVLLLGVVWTLADRVATGAASVEDDLLLAIAGAGLAVAALVAGRIVFVVGRLKRRRPSSAAPTAPGGSRRQVPGRRRWP